jgi:hypothetical protein
MITAVMMNATAMIAIGYHRRDDERHRDDRDRIEQRALDLRLDGEDLLFVVGQPVEQRLQNSGLLPCLHQVAEQRVEVKRVLAKSGGERRAGLDLGLDLEQELRHRRVRRALADDVEGLQQRHARLHHRRELPREQRDVLVGDLAAGADPLLPDLGDEDALTPQSGVDHGLAAGAHLAADHLAGLVLALPGEGRFLRPLCRCCGCHPGSP